MTDWTSIPAKNPLGGNLTADEVQIRRDAPGPIYDGAFSQAWALVQQRPLETILLSLAVLIFSGGFPCGGGGGGGGGGGTDNQWESASDYGGSIGAMFDNLTSGVGDALGLGGAEFAIIAVIIAISLVVGVVMFVLGTAIRGGATLFWLRLVRGQSASFGDTTQVIPFLVPLLFTTILSTLVIFGGFLLLIIPGIIASLGLFFVTQVVLDKNLGYVEGIKAAWRLTDGHKMDILLFAILCLLLNLAGILACCIGVVVTNAVVMGATTIVYDRLAEPGNAYLDA